MTKKHWKHVTEQEYNKARGLFKLGFTNSEAEKITKRSGQTIQIMRKSETWEEYQKNMGQFAERCRKTLLEKTVKPQDKAANGVASETWQDELIIELRVINSNLARLADAWERKPQHPLGVGLQGK